MRYTISADYSSTLQTPSFEKNFKSQIQTSDPGLSQALGLEAVATPWGGCRTQYIMAGPYDYETLKDLNLQLINSMSSYLGLDPSKVYMDVMVEEAFDKCSTTITWTVGELAPGDVNIVTEDFNSVLKNNNGKTTNIGNNENANCVCFF